MKPLHHHTRRLVQQFVAAEQATTRDDAQTVIRRAEKHQRKIGKWHRLIDRLFAMVRL